MQLYLAACTPFFLTSFSLWMTYIVGGSNNEDFYAHCAQQLLFYVAVLLDSPHDLPDTAGASRQAVQCIKQLPGCQCSAVAIALHLPLLCSYHCSADVIKQHDFGVASCLLYVLEACVSRRTMLSRQKQERKLFSEKYL